MRLNVGDTIKCHDKEDMINVHNELAINNIYTDFMYEKGGQKGLWLVVEKVGAKND